MSEESSTTPEEAIFNESSDDYDIDDNEIAEYDQDDEVADEDDLNKIDVKKSSVSSLHTQDKETVYDNEKDEEKDNFAEEFYQHFDDLKDSDNITILLKPNKSYIIFVISSLVDSIAKNYLNGNEKRAISKKNWDKKHAESVVNVFNGAKEWVKDQMEKNEAIKSTADSNSDGKESIKIDSINKTNTNASNSEQINKLVQKLKDGKAAKNKNNRKVLSYLYTLADESKELKETAQDYIHEYTLKGVFFSYTTAIDLNIYDPKHNNIYSKLDKNQGLFVINITEDGRYEIELKNNSDQVVEVMIAAHFGKYHTNYLLEQDIENISDFMSNFKILSTRLYYVITYWLNHTEYQELKSENLLYFSGIYILFLTVILVVFSVWNVTMLKNLTNRRSMV